MSFSKTRKWPLWIGLAALISAPAGRTAEIPALEGPVLRVAIKVTDQKSADEFDWYASAHMGVDGADLPGATTNVVIGLLDSGSGAHLVSYADAVALGLQGAYLSGNTFGVSGVDDVPVDLDISMPVGFFAEGLQQLDAKGNPQPALMFGQGNVASGVNSLANVEVGANTPTVIGAPFLLYFPAYIQNSRPVHSSLLGSNSTPSITFYDPSDTQIPVLAHRVYLETRPTGTPTVGYFGDINENFEVTPQIPSTILAGLGGGSLFFTASAMTFTQATHTSSGKVVVDTGAQATLLSEVAAAELGLNVQNPDFEIEVQGLVDTVTAPGFYIDGATLPAGFAGALSWSRVPVVVLNVGSPEGGTIYGILGNNLTARRDLVFNGAAAQPYLDGSAPILTSQILSTAIRPTGTNTIEVDWHAEPAAPVLYLQRCADLGLNPPQWQTVATNDLSTVDGTFSVTRLGDRNFFRIQAP